MQIILRALLYIWLLTGFSASYFLVIDLDTTTETQIGGMGWFPVVWIGGALVMGWLGDAVMFNKGTVFGRSEFGSISKTVYIAVIVIVPLASMLLQPI